MIFKSIYVNILTNSSCSFTKRNFRALPRSDRGRDGVDTGVRPLGQRLLCAGDVVNVIGENAIPERKKKIDVFSFILLIEKDKPRFLFGVRPGVKGI